MKSRALSHALLLLFNAAYLKKIPHNSQIISQAVPQLLFWQVQCARINHIRVQQAFFPPSKKRNPRCSRRRAFILMTCHKIRVIYHLIIITAATETRLIYWDGQRAHVHLNSLQRSPAITNTQLYLYRRFWHVYNTKTVQGIKRGAAAVSSPARGRLGRKVEKKIKRT
jgi:hypothetical protein